MPNGIRRAFASTFAAALLVGLAVVGMASPASAAGECAALLAAPIDRDVVAVGSTQN